MNRGAQWATVHGVTMNWTRLSNRTATTNHSVPKLWLVFNKYVWYGEVMKFLEKAYNDAKQLLTDNRSLLDEISEFLLVKETITGDELMAFVNAEKDPAPVEEPAETTEE